MKSLCDQRGVIACALGMAVAFSLTGCGNKKPAIGGGGYRPGKVESAFITAGNETGIPSRYLLAAAMLESGISTIPSQSVYLSTPTDPNSKVMKGSSLTQTAFGIPKSKLGLADGVDSDDLQKQVKAYAEWVKAQLANRGVSLTANPASAEDKYRWIWEIAQLHRSGINQRRNVRVVFAREMIDLLNEGFLWQDPNSGDTIDFSKEPNQIKIEEFPTDGQALFKLDTFRSEIAERAAYFPLMTIAQSEVKNAPTHIEVIHCPMSLSACLEMQNPTADGDVRLGAHYIVQSKFSYLDRPLQVAGHEYAVSMTGVNGDVRSINNAIVVMLVGKSGRMVDGIRVNANPGWYSDAQMRMFGSIVLDVCTVLSQRNGLNLEQCTGMTGEGGVNFQRQKESDTYKWGDIPDYDETVFEGYLKGGFGGLEGVTTLEFGGNTRQFKAGSSINLTAHFQPATRLIELERLVRCSDQKVVWAPIESKQSRSETKMEFEQRLWDGGPNGNGQQYFRIKTYGKDDALIGWATEGLFIQDFDKQAAAVAPPKYCRRNGT